MEEAQQPLSRFGRHDSRCIKASGDFLVVASMGWVAGTPQQSAHEHVRSGVLPAMSDANSGEYTGVETVLNVADRENE